MRPPTAGPATVLHVSEAFGGGVAAVMAQYAETLAEVAHRALVTCRSESVSTADKAPYVSMSTQPDRRGLAAAFLQARGGADIVHCHSSQAGVLGRLLHGRAAPRVVYSPHALAYSARRWYEPRAWTMAAEWLLRSRADAYGAVSLHEADQLRALGIEARRIVCVPHNVDVPALADRAQATDVVAVGRITHQKDPAFFAAVATVARQRWRRHGPPPRFVWIGDGEASLRRLLVDAGVEVTGWIDRDQVATLLATRAALVVHGALYEGLPLSVLETMALGVPVIARRIPSLTELESPLWVRGPQEAADLVRFAVDSVENARIGHASRDEIRKKYNRDAQRGALRRLYGLE